jgi:DNA-binding MarR family transcriptional regulator
MSVSLTHGNRSTGLSDCRRQLENYVDNLYGERAGWVGCGLGVGGYFAPGNGKKGTYSFRHGVRHRFFRWPDERSVLTKWVMENRKDYDVLICPILQTEASLKRGHAAEGTYAWSDVDIDLDGYHLDLYKEIEQLLTKGSMVIWSGGRGGAHIYLALDRPYPAQTVAELNEALRDFINRRAEAFTTGRADNKIATNALLRPPGTLNMKGRATRGSHPYPVRLDEEEYTRAPWTAEELTRRLELPRQAQGGTEVRRRPCKASPTSAPTTVAALTLQLPPEVARLTGFYTPKGIDQSRSAQLFGLIAAAIERGFTNEELLAVGRLSEPGQERARERAGDRWEERLTADVGRCIEVLRPEHDHARLTCSEAGCQSRDPVIGDILELREHFYEQYRPRTRTITTDRLVFDALIYVARKHGCSDVDMSIRDLALLAGRSPSTVWKALQRIKEAGYLQQLDVAHRGTNVSEAMLANTYHLNWENFKASTHTNQKIPREKGVGVCTNFDALGHDATGYTALGNAFSTYQAMEVGKATMAEIREYTGFKSGTVRRHLRKLEAHLLAERKLDGTWISHRRPWDEVAEELGTVGTYNRKAALYAQQREDRRAEQKQRSIDAQASWESDLVARGWVKVRGCIYVAPSSPYLNRKAPKANPITAPESAGLSGTTAIKEVIL